MAEMTDTTLRPERVREALGWLTDVVRDNANGHPAPIFVGMLRLDALDRDADVLAALADAWLASQWQPIETAPRPFTERPPTDDDDLSDSRAGDVWEYFRDDEIAPGHSWSMRPTHWKPLPKQMKGYDHG